MSQEPRFTEEEMKEIFERAANVSEGRAALSPSAGITLAELQSIGREVGLIPERIAEAATAVELRRNAVPVRTQFGMPVGVGRTLNLPRAPSDAEWETLVADLRHTFHARGKEWSSGNARQWSNGNLFAYVEPLGNGFRLRLGTTKGDATSVNLLGLAGVGIGAVVGVAAVLGGQPGAEFVAPLILGGGGASAIGANWLRLKGWAATREAQMEAIAGRALTLLSPGGAE